MVGMSRYSWVLLDSKMNESHVPWCCCAIGIVIDVTVHRMMMI